MQNPDGSSTSGERGHDKAILAVLRGPLYQAAREAIIRFEATEGERSIPAIIELRDALDHLWYAAQSNDGAVVQQRADAAEEHLRRAAVEPAQEMVEARLDAIRRSFRLYWLKRFFFSGLPESSTVRSVLQEIGRLLELGRARKAQTQTLALAIEHLGEAHTKATSLCYDLQLTGLRSVWKFIAWLIPALVGIAGILVAVLK